MSEISQYLTKSDKYEQFKKLINEALYIVSKFGVPLEGMTQRRLERIAMAFLAVANVKKTNEWGKIDNSHTLITREIIRYSDIHFCTFIYR
ncbi:hypothetical protein [Okeania sp. SIO1I7]|uniref:hypothetical protein n=1 Tax=Okeania sp. SIO1I7 TaxID=2607772 RepID=UPI0013F84925|nr:hypothetical protein [Okeania sp. SIO1I7]NET27275.1 hypothetical protein [Okeania sp. SIO1I7]